MNRIIRTGQSVQNNQIFHLSFQEFTGENELKMRTESNARGKLFFQIISPTREIEERIISICRKVHHDGAMRISSTFPCEAMLADGMIIQIASTFKEKRLIVELTRNVKGYDKKHNHDFVEMFVSCMKTVFMNLNLQLNPNLMSTNFSYLEIALRNLVIGTLKRDLNEELIKVSGEIFEFFVTFVKDPLRDYKILEVLLDFMAGDKVKTQLMVTDIRDWAWCGVFMWRMFKSAISSAMMKGKMKPIPNLTIMESELKEMVKLLNEDIVNFEEMSTLDCEIHLTQFVEYSSTINDITNQNLTSNISKIQIHKVEFTTCSGKDCRIKKGKLEINNEIQSTSHSGKDCKTEDEGLRMNDEGNWFAPPIQPIHIGICNKLLTKEIDAMNQINQLVDEMISNNCINHCYGKTDFFILLQTCENFTFNPNSNLKLEDICSKLILAIKSVEENFRYEIVEQDESHVSFLMNYLSKILYEGCIKGEFMISTQVKFMNCVISGNISSWPQILVDQQRSVSNLIITIKRRNSHFLTNISIQSLKDQVSRCKIIGSDPGATRRKHKNIANLSAEQVKLLADARAKVIENDFKKWCTKFKEIDLQVTKADIVAYTRKGKIIVDGKISISTHIFIQNALEVIQLLNDETINLYEIECSTTVPNGIELDHADEVERRELENYNSLVFYHRSKGKGFIMPIHEPEFKFPDCHWNNMGRLKFKIDSDYKFTTPLTLEIYGRKCLIAFIYNSNLSPIKCFLPKHLADYLFVPRNGGEYFEVVRSKSEPTKFKRIQVMKSNEEYNPMIFHNGQRIHPMTCEGDYAETSWFKQMNSETSHDQIVQGIKAKIITWMHDLLNSDMSSFGLPKGIEKPNQLMPVVAVLDKETTELNLNSTFLDDYVSAHLEAQKDHVQIKEFCRCFEMREKLCVSTCNTFYFVPMTGIIIVNNVNYQVKEFLQLVEKQFKKINSNQLLQLRMTEDKQMKEISQLYMKYNSSHNVRTVNVNKLEIVHWSAVKLTTSMLQSDTPSLSFKNQFALNKTWSSNHFMEIKCTNKIEWKIESGVLRLPLEVAQEYPSFNSTIISSQNDWYLKLHTFVEHFIMHILKELGHQVKVEFTTDEGNERDILVDNETIIEIKTQTMFNRAMDSFLNKSKHIGEELIATTRHSLFITQNCWEKLFKHASDKLQLLANLVGGYNEMRDSNGRIISNLFEKANFPHRIDKVLPVKTPISHDNITSINKGKTPKYTTKLESTFGKPHDYFLEKPQESNAILKMKTIEAQQLVVDAEKLNKKCEEIQQMQSEFDKIPDQFDALDVKIEATRKAAGQVKEMLDEDMKECAPFKTIEGIQIEGKHLESEFAELEKQLNQMTLEVAALEEKSENLELQLPAEVSKYQQLLEGMNSTMSKLNESPSEFEGFSCPVTFECKNVTHETMHPKRVMPSLIHVNEKRQLDFYQIETQAKPQFETKMMDLDDFTTKLKFAKCLPTLRTNQKKFKPLIVKKDTITVEGTMSPEGKKIIIVRNTSTGRFTQMKYEDNLRSLISIPGQFNCIDAANMNYCYNVIKHFDKHSKKLGMINPTDLSKDEHFAILDLMTSNIEEFMQLLKTEGAEFVMMPMTNGVTLSVVNLEAEIKRSIDSLINNFAKQVSIKGWQRGRIRFAKHAISVLFDIYNTEQLYSADNDSMHKCVTAMISMLNSSRQTELPDDVCHQVATVTFSNTPKIIKLTSGDVKGQVNESKSDTRQDVKFEVATDYMQFQF